MTLLKNCPFCGSEIFDGEDTLYPSGIVWSENEDGVRYYTSGRDPESMCWNIVCKCGCTLDGDSKEEVIDKWNNKL